VGALGGLNKQGNRVLSPLSDAKAMRILAFFLLFRFSDSTDQFYAHTKKKSSQENGWVTSYLRSSPAQIKVGTLLRNNYQTESQNYSIFAGYFHSRMREWGWGEIGGIHSVFLIGGALSTHLTCLIL